MNTRRNKRQIETDTEPTVREEPTENMFTVVAGHVSRDAFEALEPIGIDKSSPLASELDKSSPKIESVLDKSSPKLDGVLDPSSPKFDGVGPESMLDKSSTKGFANPSTDLDPGESTADGLWDNYTAVQIGRGGQEAEIDPDEGTADDWIVIQSATDSAADTVDAPAASIDRTSPPSMGPEDPDGYLQITMTNLTADEPIADVAALPVIEAIEPPADSVLINHEEVLAFDDASGADLLEDALEG